jgi:CDP-diacylglycerol--glycerol-3-phosphate 3-phosphatidyltransferase
MNLPNRITVLRIILTPVLVLLFYCRLYIICAVVFLAASLTDMIDGKIARKRGLVTVFGKFFDPLADKLINLAAIIILAAQILYGQQYWYGVFAVITAVIIVAREVIVTSLRALAASEGVVIAADNLGKLKTVLQDVAIIAMFLDESSWLEFSFAGEIIHWTAVITLAGALVLTIVSGINYFMANKQIVEKIGKDI